MCRCLRVLFVQKKRAARMPICVPRREHRRERTTIAHVMLAPC